MVQSHFSRFAIIVLFASTFLQAQSDTSSGSHMNTGNSIIMSTSRFDMYELTKKDKAVALFWTGMFPGGGLIYCDSPKAPYYLLSGLAIDYWIINNASKGKSVAIPAILSLLHKILDVSASFNAVDQKTRSSVSALD